jgi:hypothetical protein
LQLFAPFEPDCDQIVAALRRSTSWRKQRFTISRHYHLWNQFFSFLLSFGGTFGVFHPVPTIQRLEQLVIGRIYPIALAASFAAGCASILPASPRSPRLQKFCRKRPIKPSEP